MLIALGSVLYLLESFIPFPLPVPGGRWGFSNLVLLIALAELPLKDLLALAAGKSVIGSLLAGRLGTPGFVMGFSGIIFSCLIMWALYKTRVFGFVGISLAGAACNNFFQLLIAALLIVKSGQIMLFYPYMVLLGTVSALINAYIAHEVVQRLGGYLWRG